MNRVCNNLSSVASTRKFKKVTHVIFDMDGVLLDTERLYTEAMNNAVKQFGKTFDWSIKPQVMGLTRVELANKLIELLDLPVEPDTLYQQIREQYKHLFPTANLMPAISTIAQKFGKRYTPEIQCKVVGAVERDCCRIAVTEMDLPLSIDNFQSQFRSLSHQFFHKLALMPGAETLVKHLHKNNVPIAVATSSGQDSFDLKTTRYKELFSLFDHIVCGGTDPEVAKGKPSPDIFLVCASRFKNPPNPEECLVFEDAPNGVTAARAAGMQVVMMPDENVPENLQKNADVKVKNLLDVQLDLFGLPPMAKE